MSEEFTRLGGTRLGESDSIDQPSIIPGPESTLAIRRCDGEMGEMVGDGRPNFSPNGNRPITTQHVRTCRREGAQVDICELNNAMARALEGLSVLHQVESGETFTVDRDISMGIVIRSGSL